MNFTLLYDHELVICDLMYMHGKNGLKSSHSSYSFFTKVLEVFIVCQDIYMTYTTHEIHHLISR